MLKRCSVNRLFFFFNDTATTEIYTLSLHDALPILTLFSAAGGFAGVLFVIPSGAKWSGGSPRRLVRSEEHTSELQSQSNLVCRLLLEKKKSELYKIKHQINSTLMISPLPFGAFIAA